MLLNVGSPEVVLVTEGDCGEGHFVCVHELHVHDSVVLEVIKSPLPDLHDEGTDGGHHTNEPNYPEA